MFSKSELLVWKKFKYYKELIGAIILAGLMILVALRISDIASGIDALITAFVPLIVGACMAFVLDIRRPL
ncbi:hypothetical protein PZH35_09865 [Veillonella atypica]|nr:hypothetical protein [Veillonella atypica]MDE8714632.1 hypothetical protein [Veillonella atypica]